MASNGRLRLRAERLSELTTDDLRRIAGAAGDRVPETLNVKECVQTLRRCTTAVNCPVADD